MIRVILDCMWYGFPILKEFSVTNLQATVNSTSAPK